MNTPPTRTPGAGEIQVLPGEVRIATFPTHFTTVLGSAVAVCICDAMRGVGGITHFLLPDSPPAGEPDITRWAAPAINVLLQKVRMSGAHADNLEARIFGGAHIGAADAREPLSLGDQNVDSALVVLQKQGVWIVEQCTGGNAAREITFESNTGLAWTRLVNKDR